MNHVGPSTINVDHSSQQLPNILPQQTHNVSSEKKDKSEGDCGPKVCFLVCLAIFSAPLFILMSMGITGVVGASTPVIVGGVIAGISAGSFVIHLLSGDKCKSVVRGLAEVTLFVLGLLTYHGVLNSFALGWTTIALSGVSILATNAEGCWNLLTD